MTTVFLLVLMHTYLWDSTPDKYVKGNAEVRTIVAQFSIEKACIEQQVLLMKNAIKHDYFICLPADK